MEKDESSILSNISSAASMAHGAIKTGKAITNIAKGASA